MLATEVAQALGYINLFYPLRVCVCVFVLVGQLHHLIGTFQPQTQSSIA
jgi:hypothetical protein